MSNIIDPALLDGTAYISLQNPCNASCPMCLSWRDDSTLPFESVRDALRALAAQGWRLVIFTGGEFIDYPNITELVELTTDLGMNFGFITNGTALSADHNGTLNSPSLCKVVLSRDFSDPEHHAHWRRLPVFSDGEIAEIFARLAARHVFCQVNTVLMPRNVDDLSNFAGLPFWSSLHQWHLIPVKGPMAKSWTEEQRARFATVAADLNDGLTPGPTVISPLPSGFADLPLLEIRSSRPTESAVRGRSCTVERRQLYIDASGHVLPCNSIDWDHRRTIGFGNLREESAESILNRRRYALEADHNRERTGCHACDPLNFSVNSRFSITS